MSLCSLASLGSLYTQALIVHFAMSVSTSGAVLHTHADGMLDCKGGTGKSQGESTVPARDCEHPGQGSGALEEKICLLDPGAASRRERSGERAMGRNPCDGSVGQVGGGEPEEEWQRIDDSQLFFVHDSTTSNYWDWWMGRGMVGYERIETELVLGDSLESDEEDIAVTEHRCFNCGSPTHLVTSCPQPHNHAVVDLSRQLANFYRNIDGKQVMQRIHVVEGWKQQRLDWLSSFEPGEIRGPLLRDALGLNPGDIGDDVPWLQSMAYWGYPKGWTGGIDPREQMRKRILADDDSMLFGSEVNPNSSMIVFNDIGDEETVDLRDAAEEPPSHISPALGKFQRWASYPKSQFLYTLLPIFSGHTLPPLESESFTLERQKIWHELINQPPPAPTSTPPPLPSTPPPPPLPPLPDDEDSEEDMDLSDSD